MARDARGTEVVARGRGVPWAGIGWAAALVAAATGLSVLVRPYLNPTDTAMIYVLVIMVTAFAFGRWPSIAAAALSVAAYDFFSVPPYLTFNIEAAKHIWTFAMMFGIGIVVSGLMERIRRQEREAEAAALRARTEEMRSSLLSAVSHDLRTPLATIVGAGTALRDEPDRLGSAQREELLATICDEAERMERLIGNLLDMTRVDSGALALKREWVPLEEIVGSALTRLERRLAGRDVVMRLAEDLPLLSADPVLLEQALANLVDNALKYSPPGSPVEIAAVVRDEEVAIEIADRGPGLRPGEEARVFDKFYRGQGHPGVGGAGLGLSVCRGVVAAHGGTIAAENRADGGAVFRIRLPLLAAPALKELAP